MTYPVSLDDVRRRAVAVLAATEEEAALSADPAETYERLLHEAGDHPLAVVVAAVLGQSDLSADARSHLELCGTYALRELEDWGSGRP